MLRVIGHRGARTLAVENSLLALRAAVDAGADGVEIDVQLSADGEPVVFHDDDLLRLCGAPGFLWQRSWRELREVRMADAGLQPQPIAHLDSVLEWWLSAGVLINIELKVADNLPTKQMRQLVQVVARRLREMPAPQLVVSSFSRSALEEFADLAPHLRCADRAGAPLRFLAADPRAAAGGRADCPGASPPQPAEPGVAQRDFSATVARVGLDRQSPEAVGTATAFGPGGAAARADQRSSSRVAHLY